MLSPGWSPGQYQVREILADGYSQTSPGGNGAHTVILAEGQQVTGLDFGNTQPTKFYVVDDATANKTFEYRATGNLAESYLLNTGNTAPRGAASTIAGDKVWVVDANRRCTSTTPAADCWARGLPVLWPPRPQWRALPPTAPISGSSMPRATRSTSTLEPRARLSGSQNAASSFSLNKNNKSPKDIVTDGSQSVGRERFHHGQGVQVHRRRFAGQQLDHHHRRCDQPDRDHD